MVYRYESDEDASEGFRKPGADPTAPDARRTAPAGPSPSRFPPPAVPRPIPPADDPVRAVVPVPQPVAPPPVTPAGQDPDAVRSPLHFAAESAPPAAEPPHAEQSPASPPEQTTTWQPEPATVEQPEQATVEQPEQATVGQPAPRPRAPGGRLWQVAVGGAAVLVLLAVCGLGTAAIMLERESGPEPQGQPTPPPVATRSESPAPANLDSRDTDPLPLTAREVFPDRQLVVASGQPAYQVLRTHSSGSCEVAATDDIADLLVRLGCNQVVRATVRAPGGDYLATAGLFNLTDRVTAERVRDRTREILQERRGRFLGMEADSDRTALTTAAARVSWQARGHYVAYCVVVRADGQPVRPDDQAAKRVLLDLVQTHLERGVLDRRADGDLAQPTPGRDESTRRTTAPPADGN